MENRVKQKKFVSLVLYLHNTQNEVVPFFQKVLPVFRDNFTNFEIVCVNDACTDGTIGVLKEYLELLENDYDYILIDCMPSLGMMTINALSAADSVLIPVQPQYYAADGLMELLKVVKGIHQRFNPDLQIEGILFTMDSSHYNHSKRNKQAVRDAYGAEIRIFDQTIPRTEALAETASEGVSIFSYDAKGKGAYSYQALVQEVLNHA